MKLEVLGMSINEEYIEPKIRAAVRINGITERQVVYHATGFLGINGKIIDKCDFLLQNEQYLNPKSDKNKNLSSVDITFDFNISKKALNEINLYRKQEFNKKKEVKFTIKVYLGVVEANIVISHIREIAFGHPHTKPYNPADLPSISNGVAELKNVMRQKTTDVSALYYVYDNDYSPDRSDMDILSADNDNNRSLLKFLNIYFNNEYVINSSDWLLDFSPKLGAGEYEIIELPKLKIDNSNTNFKNSLNYLETAKEKLYALETGSAQTALRNSIKAFNEALMGLGYATKDEKGKRKADYAKIFSNNNISQLADSLQKWLYGTASRGPEAMAPHASDVQIEGYEVEPMISMAYSLYKILW